MYSWCRIVSPILRANSERVDILLVVFCNFLVETSAVHKMVKIIDTPIPVNDELQVGGSYEGAINQKQIKPSTSAVA